MHDIVCFGDQSANAEKSWHLSFRHFCLKLVFRAKHNRRLHIVSYVISGGLDPLDIPTPKAYPPPKKGPVTRDTYARYGQTDMWKLYLSATDIKFVILPSLHIMKSLIQSKENATNWPRSAGGSAITRLLDWKVIWTHCRNLANELLCSLQYCSSSAYMETLF